MLVNLSIGEVVDRLSILLIKQSKILDIQKQIYILKEIKEINKLLENINLLEFEELMNVNLELWDINEKRKKMIENSDFGEEFVKLSVQESKLNDQRFSIKQRINNRLNSELQEQKSYKWA